MSLYSFTDPDTKRTFSIKVPSGVTEDQARTIFQQQLNTGSLAGFDVGATLSAATQAAAGLPAAQAVLAQAASVAAGQLPSSASLNTIASQLGAVPGVSAIAGQVGAVGSAATSLLSGLPGASQITSSLQGAGAALASNVVGTPINAALTAVKNVAAIGTGIAGGIVGALGATGTAIAQQANALASLATSAITSPGSVLASATALVGKAGTAITGAVTQAASLASTAVKNIASSLTGPVTNGINTADLIKQGTALPLPDLNAVDTQAALSQAAKLVGQPRVKMSDDLGLGKFGLDLSQLETAGYIKPGITAVATAAAAAGSSVASLPSVLNSPTAFTGKDGIKTVSALLNNEAVQNTIQTNLMSQGLNELKSAGIPVADLNAGAVAGLANNAAKSVTNTLSSLQGLAPPAVKAQFDTVTKNTAFAVTLAETKVEPAVVGEVSAAPATNTVNSETLNAAAARVVGNPKVPSVSEPPVPDAKERVSIFLKWIDSLYQTLKALVPVVDEAEKNGKISQDEWSRINAAFKAVQREFNAENLRYQTETYDAIKALPEGYTRSTLTTAWELIKNRNLKSFLEFALILKDRIAALEAKIQA